MANPHPIRVLVVEDSPAQLTLLLGILRASGEFEVVGTAADGREAVAATARLRPQVVAMDIHLPVIDGYEAARQIMQRSPTPIVMVSSSPGDADRRALQALAAGALAVVRKPGGPGLPDSSADRANLLRTLRLMSGVRVVTRHPPRPAAPPPAPRLGRPVELLAVAASTGGPAALQTLLSGLGPGLPVPVLVVQHIARGFTAALVDWLAGVVPQPISLVDRELALEPGRVYFAAEGCHLVVPGPGLAGARGCRPADRYCPSADLLFASAAAHYGAAAAGLIMTGMGDDGAQGLAQLRAAGAPTLGQDAPSCVVYGMPQAAKHAGAVGQELPLAALAPALLALISRT